MKEKRIWHNHIKWEDLKAGLYESNKKENHKHVKQSNILLADESKLNTIMRQVTKNWPFATAHNLSNKSSNRKAWLGQAACCLHHGANDDATKKAWNKLTIKEQRAANNIAKQVIQEWEKKYYGVGDQLSF